MVVFDAEFCPYCGEPLTPAGDHYRCPACPRMVFRNPVPAVAVTVVDGARVLAVERATDPWKGEWSTPGGHIERDEEPAAAAARELREETTVRVEPAALEPVGGRTLPPRDGKHVVTIEYAVRRAATVGEPSAGDETSAVAWVHSERFPEHGPGTPSFVRERVDDALAALGST